MFLLPTIVTIIFYILIFLVAKGHASRIHPERLRTFSSHIPTLGLKATKTVAIVVGVYVLCQTPYNIFQIIIVLDKSLALKLRALHIGEWLFYYSSWNSVASPVIYGFFDKNLRNAVKILFKHRSRASTDV